MRNVGRTKIGCGLFQASCEGAWRESDEVMHYKHWEFSFPCSQGIQIELSACKCTLRVLGMLWCGLEREFQVLRVWTHLWRDSFRVAYCSFLWFMHFWRSFFYKSKLVFWIVSVSVAEDALLGDTRDLFSLAFSCRSIYWGDNNYVFILARRV